MFDVVIVGGGSAGRSIARAAAQVGARVALIEKHPETDGKSGSAYWPSKGLVQAAKLAHQLKGTARFGIRTDIEPDRFRRGDGARPWCRSQACGARSCRASGAERNRIPSWIGDIHRLRHGGSRRRALAKSSIYHRDRISRGRSRRSPGLPRLDLSTPIRSRRFHRCPRA